jgi:crossover junction endodeoxyribonuclease RuvC
MSADDHDTKSETDGGDSFGRRRHRPHHDNPMEASMATMTLTQRQLNASVAAPVPIEVLAGGKPTPPVILALDLGQRTGWAVRNRDDAVASGTHEFRPGRFDGGGMIWLRFRAWLREVDETSGGVGVVVFEEVRRHLGTSAGHIYGGYLAHLTAWAEANRIPYRGVPVGTIKRHVTGKGNADKAAVIEAVRGLGFAPADDNEADALALLHWAIAQGIGDDR